MHRPAAALAVICGAACMIAPAGAEDFYQGKTVNVIVGNTPSSGYDPYARLLARHMPRHLPGRPTMIVQNMPGAGSVKATEYTYLLAPKDGTAFTLVMPGALVEPLTDASKFRYDATKFEFLGTADVGTRMCLTIATSKAKTYDDAKRLKVVMGATGVASSLWDYPYFLNAFAGAKMEVVSGYPASGDVLVAMERGEVDGVCGLELSSLRSLRPDWVGTPKANMLLQIGVEAHPEMSRLGIPVLWPHVPAENREVVELIVSQQVFQRPFVAPPGTPQAQVKLLRAAFLAALKDPETLADAKKMNIEINAKSGEEVGALVRKMYASPKPLIERMGKAIRP